MQTILQQLGTQMDSSSLRINVIMRQGSGQKISLITHPKTAVSKLKRQIEAEFQELHNLTILVSVVEDDQGFTLSNNSSIGDHIDGGSNGSHSNSTTTLFIRSHKNKTGTDMNLPSNITDIFMTLRYVCGSVIRKLQNLQGQISLTDVMPQILHLGFWYSNIQTVAVLCRFLNKHFSQQSIDRYYKTSHDIQNVLLIKMLSFWFIEVTNSFSIFPQICSELLALLQKLTINEHYCQMLKSHKMTKQIIQLSKDPLLSQQMKKIAIRIVKNIQGRGRSDQKSGYIPTLLGSEASGNNIQEVLELLNSPTQQSKLEALQMLTEPGSELISEGCVRFDYYYKLTALFTLKSFPQRRYSKLFNQAMTSILNNTTKQKAAQVMQRDILKRIHNYLLEGSPDTHPIVYEYLEQICKQTAVKGIFNVQHAAELMSSPYPKFQMPIVDSLSIMTEKDRKISPIRFLPNIKDYIRLALKSDNEQVSKRMLKILSNLTLDEQCRYQIVNLKGIQIFIKFLESTQTETQALCAKGLLNLSISSREMKAKILGLMTSVLQKYYKGGFDPIAQGYIEAIMKNNKG